MIAFVTGGSVTRAIALATIQHSNRADAKLRIATHSAVVSRTAGRLHGPDDAQVEPREVDVERRAIALLLDI